jgi:hypothetical protein
MSVVTLPGTLFFGPEGTLFGIGRIALSAALIVGVVVLWRRPEGRAIVALALFPVAGAAAVWVFGEPVFNERNLLAVTPFMAILVTASIGALPRRVVASTAIVVLVATIAGAAYAQSTLGRVEYHGLADSLVELGWTEGESIAIDSPTSKTSLRIAVGWYLPNHPVLARARDSDRGCSTLFAIGRSSVLRPWLERSRVPVQGLRELRSYDHPFRGRPNGRILVVRFRNPMDLPMGDVLSVREQRVVPCRSTVP